MTVTVENNMIVPKNILNIEELNEPAILPLGL